MTPFSKLLAKLLELLDIYAGLFRGPWVPWGPVGDFLEKPALLGGNRVWWWKNSSQKKNHESKREHISRRRVKMRTCTHIKHCLKSPPSIFMRIYDKYMKIYSGSTQFTNISD